MSLGFGGSPFGRPSMVQKASSPSSRQQQRAALGLVKISDAAASFSRSSFFFLHHLLPLSLSLSLSFAFHYHSLLSSICSLSTVQAASLLYIPFFFPFPSISPVFLTLLPPLPGRLQISASCIHTCKTGRARRARTHARRGCNSRDMRRLTQWVLRDGEGDTQSHSQDGV